LSITAGGGQRITVVQNAGYCALCSASLGEQDNVSVFLAEYGCADFHVVGVLSHGGSGNIPRQYFGRVCLCRIRIRDN
jgi:hypothetical protein